LDLEWNEHRLKKAVIRSKLGGNCRLETAMPERVEGAEAKLAGTAANPNPAYTALSETGASTNLLTWTEPVTASRVTLGFQQSIGASETLLRGTYGKTVTFTLSSTTP
jgi:hypothetical protein